RRVLASLDQLLVQLFVLGDGGVIRRRGRQVLDQIQHRLRVQGAAEEVEHVHAIEAAQVGVDRRAVPVDQLGDLRYFPRPKCFTRSSMSDWITPPGSPLIASISGSYSSFASSLSTSRGSVLPLRSHTSLTPGRRIPIDWPWRRSG